MSIFNLIGDDGLIITDSENLTVEEALDLSCFKLLKNNKIKCTYLDAIKACHKEIGPYYVLAPKLAMPHARPEDGVNETSLQVTVFKNGVNFGSDDNGDVYLAITLAAFDSNNHIETIMALSELFQNNVDIEKIISAESEAEIIDILKQY